MREGRLNGLAAHVELPMQQLVLVLTLIHWRKETKDHGRGEKKETEKD